MNVDTATGLLDAARWCPSPNRDARPDPDDISGVVVHGISLPPGEFGGGVVQHEATGLQWSRCAIGQTYNAGRCDGAATVFYWDEARDAIDRLRHPEQPAGIIGPATDGGFWLVGANHRLPREAWTAPAYSRPDTRERFLAAMRKHPPSPAWQELDTLTDVDTADDLDAVVSALQALKTPTPEQRELLELTLSHRHA